MSLFFGSVLEIEGREGDAWLASDRVFQLPLLPRNLASARTDLNSEDSKVRLQAVRDLPRELGGLERQARVKLLVQALDDKSADVRRAALLGLSDFEAKEASADVLRLFSDVDLRVRQFAILCLGEIADPANSAVTAALRELTTSPEPRFRYQALSAFCRLVPDEAASVLGPAVSDSDPELRDLSLRLIDEVLVSGGYTLNEGLQTSILRGASDVDAGVRLLAQLVAAEQRWDAPRDMLLAVVRRRFKVREPRDEQQAIVLCGELGLREAIPSLVRRAMGWFGWSMDPFRWVALGALVRLGDDQAFSKLSGAMHSRRHSDRAMAAHTLAQAGDQRALPVLQQALERATDTDRDMIRQALRALNET